MTPVAGGTRPSASPRRPLYVRLLRLRHLRLAGWQRALLGDGSIALAVLLVLADLASAWTLLVLPVAVAVAVKVNDVLAGVLTEVKQPAVESPVRQGRQEVSQPEPPRPRGGGVRLR